MKRILAFSALILVLGVSARADSYSATILSGQGGQSLTNGQYAGTFSVSTNGGPSYSAFCVDLVDHVSFGTTNFTGTSYSGGLPNGTPLPNVWSNSVYKNTDLGARLDYVLTQIFAPALPTLTNAQGAAFQAALWNITSNYGYHDGGGLVDQIMQLVGAPNSNGTAVSGSSWALLNSVAAYQQGTTYSSASEFMISPDQVSGDPTHHQYQVLIGITPEPSTMAIGGLGALGLVAYSWRRRKATVA